MQFFEEAPFMNVLRTRRLLIPFGLILTTLVLVAAVILNPLAGRVADPFGRATAGLPEATPTAPVALRDGDTFDLRAGVVRKRIGDAEVRMFAYNDSVPG